MPRCSVSGCNQQRCLDSELCGDHRRDQAAAEDRRADQAELQHDIWNAETIEDIRAILQNHCRKGRAPMITNTIQTAEQRFSGIKATIFQTGTALDSLKRGQQPVATVRAKATRARDDLNLFLKELPKA